MQSLQKSYRRDTRKLTLCAAITGLAGQHQIPDAVEVADLLAEHQRQKVIDIRQVLFATRHANGTKAVKAPAFLVAIQAAAAAGNGDAATALTAEKHLVIIVIINRNQVT